MLKRFAPNTDGINKPTEAFSSADKKKHIVIIVTSRPTCDDVLNLLFAQQLLASLQQKLDVQHQGRAQLRGRHKALTHLLQEVKGKLLSASTQYANAMNQPS